MLGDNITTVRLGICMRSAVSVPHTRSQSVIVGVVSCGRKTSSACEV